MSDPTEKKITLLERFRRYYTTCRNKDGTFHHIGSTSRWRAFIFAVEMTWWSVRHG